jgi:hypothetical protein
VGDSPAHSGKGKTGGLCHLVAIQIKPPFNAYQTIQRFGNTVFLFRMWNMLITLLRRTHDDVKQRPSAEG